MRDDEGANTAAPDAIQTRTTIMSKVPMANVFGTPADAFDYILNAIIATDPSKREALIKPHLQTFIDHPIIKDITGQSEAHAPADGTLPTTLELKRIQDSLNSLSKAVDCLSKGNPPSKKLVLVGHYFVWHIRVLSDVLYHHPLILKLLVCSARRPSTQGCQPSQNQKTTVRIWTRRRATRRCQTRSRNPIFTSRPSRSEPPPKLEGSWSRSGASRCGAQRTIWA